MLLLTHYYAPEIGAPQTRLRETVRHLRDLDCEVRVVTGHPHYPGGRAHGAGSLSLRRDKVDGIAVTRLPTLARKYRSGLDRIVDHAWFSFVTLAAIAEARWADVVLVESPPLFLGLPALWYRLLGRPYVFHVADPWPDYPIALGALTSPTAISLARSLERASYRWASRVTTPTEGVASIVRRNVDSPGKVIVLPNAVDGDRFSSERSLEECRHQLGWPANRFIFLYLGTIGLAQGIGTLLDAVASLVEAGQSKFEVRIVGDGADRVSLEAQARRSGLNLVRFSPPVRSELVPMLMRASDASIVMLKGGMGSIALPTKLVETMAAGVPVVLSADGEAAEIVSSAKCGVVSAAEDVEGLAAAMLEMMETTLLAEMSANGRAVARERFDRLSVVSQLKSVLVEVAAPSRLNSQRASRP
ncbi:MAG: glycosyltransferase family 4 protein [Chloroflexota bacterium]